MRKVLVVGCGGSGAKTLAYMMDQLHADLSVYGIDTIPGCWQFLNVDTPTQEESPGEVGSVSAQGGTYVSCGVTTGSYRTVDDSLTRQVQAKNRAGLRQLATWIPRSPSDVPFPVSVGAGQCRGIGRLLILDRISAVAKAVEGALAAMASPESVAQAAEVNKKVPGMDGVPDAAAPPMVLVVSSMAGGSGASMTLDVCRVIASMEPAIDPQLISLFLYTAEVFADVPQDQKDGMPGNTLAMLGEIIAAQSSQGGCASELDERLYSLLGNSIHAPRAFKRIVPIGLKVGGTGAVFGDGTALGVFRGIGRGLARFISSPAFDSYVSYDMANKIELDDRNNVSWGVDPTETAWGSFGYASMSTGRDRYAEYAAQRMARYCVDHLLTGFRTPGDVSGDTQILDRLWQNNHAEELARMGMPNMMGQAHAVGNRAVDEASFTWLLDTSTVANRTLLENSARQDAEAIMASTPHLEQMTVAQWGEQMSTWLLSQEPAWLGHLDGRIRDLARQRAREMHAWIVEQIRWDIANFGIPYALRVLTELRQEGGVIMRLAADMNTIAQQRSMHPFELPKSYTDKLRAQVKATLSSAGLQHFVTEMTGELTNALTNWFLQTLASYLAAILSDMPASALKPLETQLNDRHEILKRDSRLQDGVAGVADVATDMYSAWPSEPDALMTPEQAVPKRFATAHNEVVLMDVAKYPTAFAEHVVASVPVDFRGGFNQAYREVRRNVIMGQWEQGSAAPAPADLIVVTDAWVPAGLPESLDYMPTPARYEVTLTCSDILRRARKYVARTGEAFESFVSQSLLDYLQDDGVGDAERMRRGEELLSGMKRAMEMARPLMSIDAQVFRALQGGKEPRLTFSFSRIPFAHTWVERQLLDYASKEKTFDGTTVAKAIQDAMSDDQVARVDIFGSFPRTLPVAYSGLLGSVSAAWHRAEGSDGARKAFWQFRRARPLPGGLPVGDEDRKAMVRGWWLASLAGGIKRPDWSSARPSDPISVWEADRGYVEFPAPLLTSNTAMITPNSALAAVLESILLAYLNVDEHLDVFRPWRVLRQWGDDSSQEHEVRFEAKSKPQKVIGELLGQGACAGLPPSPILGEATSPEERRAKLLAFCDAVLTDLDTRYLPGDGKREDFGYFTNISSRETVASVPLSIDMAEEMFEELKAIREIVETEPAALPQSDGQRLRDGMVY